MHGNRTRQPSRTEIEGLAQLVRTDWVGITEHILGSKLWGRQADILRLLQEHDRVAVKACSVSGKSFVAGAAVHCFLLNCLVDGVSGRVVTTAGSFGHVKDVLWHEIRTHHSRAEQIIPLGGRMLNTEYHLDDIRWAVGISTDKPGTFRGRHAARTLVIVDEATEVESPIWEAVENIMAGGEAKLLIISNPTSSTGEFFDAFHRKRHIYQTMTISAYDTPNVIAGKIVMPGLISAEWVKQQEELLGADDPYFMAYVLGEFPEISIDTIVSLAAVERAVKRAGTPGEHILAVDLSRMGDDKCAMAHLEGDIFHPIEVWGKTRMDVTLGKAVSKYRELGGNDGNVLLVMDSTGLGESMSDFGSALGGTPITRYKDGEDAVDKERFRNRRTEAWFRFAHALDMNRVTLPNDPELIAELTAPKYIFQPDGRRRIEQKEDTKKRLGRSPDRADAVIMAWYYHGTGEDIRKFIHEHKEPRNTGTRYSMAQLFDRGFTW